MISKDIEYRYTTSSPWYENKPGHGFEEVTGRFKIGKDNKNEVWKTFLSTKKGESKKPGVRMDYGVTHIWPSYRLQYIPNTFIYKAWSLSNWGHMQDVDQNGYQYLDGTFSSPGLTLEFDPAGGYGHFKIEAKESSMWHPLAIVVRVEEGNRTTETPKDELFSFDKKEDKWYVYDTVTQKDVVDNDALTKWNKGYTIEKIGTDTLKNGNWVQRFKIKKDLTNHNISTPLGQGIYDYDIWYNIGPNNTISNSISSIYIEGYYDERGDYHKSEESYEIKIGSWKQKPNILYFCNMAWVNKPRTTSEPPTPIDATAVEYTDTTINLFLYVELGISPNGGHDIYWNQDVPNNPLLSSRFPSDLASSVVVTISRNDPEFDATGKYTKFKVSNYGGNYLIVSGSSMSNNEHNNPSSRRIQDYYIDDVMYDPDMKVYWSPNHNPNMTTVPRVYQVTTSDTSDDNHVLHQTFTVKKKTTTKPWNISIKATLNYKKYKGSTEGKLAGEK